MVDVVSWRTRRCTAGSRVTSPAQLVAGEVTRLATAVNNGMSHITCQWTASIIPYRGAGYRYLATF